MLGKKIFYIVFIFAGTLFGESFQDLADSAAKTPDKILKLEAKTYFVDKPVMLTAAHNGLKIEGKEGSVLSGGKRVSGWTRDGKLWKAKLDGVDYVSSLFVNGVRADFARTPNDGYVYFYRDGACEPRRSFVFSKSDVKELTGMSEEELKNVEVRAFFQWIDNKGNVERIEETQFGDIVRIHLSSEISYHFCKYGKQGRCWFANYKGALDMPGEYFYDSRSGELWYMPREGENMESAEVFVPNTNTLLSIKGESCEKKISGISVKNLIFEYASQKPTGTNGTWQNASQAATTMSNAIEVSKAEGVCIEDCVVRNVDGYAVEFGEGVRDSVLRNCVLEKLGGGGVKIGICGRCEGDSVSGNIKVVNNIICGFGRVNRSAVGVIAYDVFGITIKNNDIFDGYYSGVSVGWVWGYGKSNTKNNSVDYNHIHHLGYGQMCDMGGIYTLGIQPESRIKGNLIHDVNCHQYGGWGIYNDEGSSFIESSMNCVYSTQSGGYHMHYGQNCKMLNNLIFDCKDYQIALSRQAPNSFSFENNIVCYKSPEVLIQKGKVPLPDSVFFNENVYWNENGEVMFDNLTFKQWQEGGRDKDSLVEAVDPKAIMNGEPFTKTNFKRIDISKAGVTGKMKPVLRKMMKSYVYPDVKNYPLEGKARFYTVDTFQNDKLGGIPNFPNIYGGELTVKKDDTAPNGRALSVKNKKISYKGAPERLPYFYYNCWADESADCARAEFSVKLTPQSSFSLEFRNEEHKHLGNRVVLDKAKIFGVQLPVGEWLRFEFAFPQPLGKSAEGYKLKILDSKKNVLLERAVKPNIENLDYFSSMYFIMHGNEGEETCFSDILIK